MPRKPRKVSYVVITTFTHSTENPEKVKKALLTLIPPDLRDMVEPKYKVLEGHMGSTVTIMELDVRDADYAEKIVDHIFSLMEEFDKDFVISTLGERVDRKGVLYIRFDKQAAFKGLLRLHEGDDVVRVKIAFPPHMRREEELRKLLRGSV